MTEKQYNQIVGRLNALEILTSQSLITVFKSCSDPQAYAENMKEFLEKKTKLFENTDAQIAFENCYASILESALLTAQGQ